MIPALPVKSPPLQLDEVAVTPSRENWEGCASDRIGNGKRPRVSRSVRGVAKPQDAAVACMRPLNASVISYYR